MSGLGECGSSVEELEFWFAGSGLRRRPYWDPIPVMKVMKVYNSGAVFRE